MGIIPGHRDGTDHCQFEGPLSNRHIDRSAPSYVMGSYLQRNASGFPPPGRRSHRHHHAARQGRCAIHAAAYAADEQLFEGVKNSICAGIDRDRRAIAPCNRALPVGDKQRTFVDALACTIGAVFPCHLALGFEIGAQRKCRWRSRAKAAWHQTPSAEIPYSSASCLRNSGRISV
jgi:hypothetical protein